MTDSIRDAKLVQYLSEAYAKEKELETALESHIGMTTRKPYQKRLEEHLKETKSHARELERRIKKIGGEGPQLLEKYTGSALGKAKSLAKGPLHMVRGTGEAEKMLKNAKTEYWNEHEEIATYTAIEVLAESVGDRETAKLARSIRRDEERMASFLAKQIPVLTKAVVSEEVPASERRSNASGGSRSSRAKTRRRSSSSKSASSSRSSGSKSGPRSSRSSKAKSAPRSRSAGARSGSRSRTASSRSSS